MVQANRQPQWDVYEAVVLLEGYFETIEKTSSKRDVIHKVSKELRQMAINRGLDIDEVYRNENGITFQMQSMASAYAGQTLKDKPATKLFMYAVGIYKDDREQYGKILKKAKNMIEGKELTVKEQFLEWLNGNASKVSITFINSYTEIVEEYAKKKHIFWNSLFENNDLPTLKRLRLLLGGDKTFRFQHKNDAKQMVQFLSAYIDFISDWIEDGMQSEDVANLEKKESVVDNSSGIVGDESTVVDTTIEKVLKDGETLYTVDFTIESNYANTKPYTLIYKDEKERYTNWIKLYAALLSKLYAEVPEVFETMKDTTAVRSGAYLVTSSKNNLRKPLEIAAELYVEANISAGDIVKRSGDFIKRCRVKYCDVVIQYVKRISGSNTARKVNLEPVVIDFDSEHLEEVKSILLAYFSRGYRCGDSIAMELFRGYYENKYVHKLELDDVALDAYIEASGVEYNGSIYCPETIMDSQMEQKVMYSIERKFSQGIPVVYFGALFREFFDNFLDYNVYDANMLKTYIIHKNDGRYHIEGDCIKAEQDAELNPFAEVENLLLCAGRPMEIQDVISELSYIPEDKIRSVFYQASKIKSGGRGIVFHVDTFSISTHDVEAVATIVGKFIKENDFATGKEMLEQIRQKHLHIIEKNSYFRETGLRNALYYHLRDRFTFNNNIITALGTELTVRELFQYYAQKKKHFTQVELHEFARSIDSQIYYDSVSEVALRVSNMSYVLNEEASFNVSATDTALDMYCTGDYIPIIAVDSFILFPAAGHPWNSYLLESYTAKFSGRYKLIHVNYTAEGSAGVIVKKSSRFNNLTDIVIDELARSECEISKSAALDYLVDKGFISSRRWDHMEMVLIEAKRKRGR